MTVRPNRFNDAYGLTPTWHDIRFRVTGPAVYDVATVFRERWANPAAPTRWPWQTIPDRLHGAAQVQPRSVREVIGGPQGTGAADDEAGFDGAGEQLVVQLADEALTDPKRLDPDGELVHRYPIVTTRQLRSTVAAGPIEPVPINRGASAGLRRTVVDHRRDGPGTHRSLGVNPGAPTRAG